VKAALVGAVLAFALTASAQSAPPPPAALIAALAMTPPGTAGSGKAAVVFPVGAMRAQLASYIGQAKAKGSAGAILEDFGTYKVMLSVRGRSSGAEVHSHWNDVMIVEQGSAVLVTGGRVIDAHTDAQGETRGIRIEGGQRQAIGAGDILTVPAGTPYQLVLSPGTVCSAFVIRMRQP
jgi:mannose-6-phosphate isomerase-like protein (cupin superfamily)